MVEPDETYEKQNSTIHKASQTVNQYGNKYWYVKVYYE